MNRALRAAWAVVLGVLAGCAAPSAEPPPAIFERIAEFERRGFRAQADGECRRALSYYRQALRLNRSVENLDGIATDLLDLAILYRKLDRDEDARAAIDEASALPEIQAFIRSDAAYERARLYLKQGDFASAERSAERALSLDKTRRTQSRLNLLGRIALLDGRHALALNRAQAALDSERDGMSPKTERANSLRLMAQAYARMGRDDEAKSHYLAALRADKEAGAGAKAALDLRSLGELSLKAGDRRAAEAYFRRAAVIDENGGQGGQEAGEP